MQSINRLIHQIPDREIILNVFGMTICFIYSWTLFASFYSIPSWIYFLDVFQIISIYAYSFAFDFVESVSTLFVILLIELIIIGVFNGKPDGFRSRAILFLLVVISFSAFRLFRFNGYEDMLNFSNYESIWWLGGVLLYLVLITLALKITWMKTFLDDMVDRASVFLYIYLPLSLISLLIVIIRNIS